MTCGISVLMVALGTWQMSVSSNLLLLAEVGTRQGSESSCEWVDRFSDSLLS